MTKNKMWDNSNMQEELEWGNVPVGNMSDEELYKKNWNKVEGRRSALANPKNREKYYDNEQWLKACAKKRAESLKSPEVSAKLSAAHKKRYEDPTERAKTAQATKDSFLTDPTRAKRQADNSKKTWANPQLRKQVSESHKKQWKDPAKRQQLSESMKSIRKYAMICKDLWFESSQAAADYFGVSRDMIGYYRKKYPEEYYYADKKPHCNKKK